MMKKCLKMLKWKKRIQKILYRTFTRFSLTMAYVISEAMAFNVPENIKAKIILFSIDDKEI